MPTLETAETTAGRFDSLEAMRAAHAGLLKTLPDEGLSGADADRVKDFLGRGAATGALLDGPADRKAAQGLLDYWRATLYAESRDRGPNQTAGEAPSQRLNETVLAPFDAATVSDLAKRAEAAVAALPLEEQELTRRLLQRVVRLAADRRAFDPDPTPRAMLEGMGDPARVRQALDRLTSLGVLRVEGERYSLAYEALTRSWERLRTWLEQRLRFRDAAQYWDKCRRNQAALISDKLLDEAREYHDKNDLENEFVRASRHREKSRTRNYRALMIVFAALAFAAIVCAVAAVIGWWRASEKTTAAEEAAGEARKAEARATAALVEEKKAKADLGEALSRERKTLEEKTKLLEKYERAEARAKANNEKYERADARAKANDEFAELAEKAMSDERVKDLVWKGDVLDKKEIIALETYGGTVGKTWPKELLLAYDPNFLGVGFKISLPSLSPDLAAHAFQGGKPLDYYHYSLVLHQDRATALYSAGNHDRIQKAKSTLAAGFNYDPRVPRQFQLGPEIYTKQQLFDRGHLISRSDIMWGEVPKGPDGASKATFGTAVNVYTNITPQHRKFNIGLWLAIEDWARTKHNPSANRVTLITGPVLRPNDYSFRGARIPRTFWKIAISPRADKKGLVVDALMADQYDPKDPGQALHHQFNATEFNPDPYRTSVAEIERLTGLNFGELRTFDPRSKKKS